MSVFNWTNRNTFTGASDNRFDDVFGTQANQAIAVIDATLAYWARTISNFNYSNGTNTFDVTISMNATAMGSGPGGVGLNAGVSANIGNKPSAANVGIGWRSGIAAGTNTAAAWFLDPTPMDNSEFTGTGAGTSAFTGLPTAGLGGADLFTGVLHELGHSVGLSSNATINAFATDTGVTDTVNTPAAAPPAKFYRFDSPNAHVLWTAWDSGGAGGAASNRTGAQHYAPLGSPTIVQAGRTYNGATALMNASFTNRSIIDDNIAYMLQDAYAYTITPPSRFGTFYDRLDNDGTLTIVPPAGNTNQTLDLQVVGSQLFVTLGVGAPVAGIDPNSILSTLPLSSVQRINIDMGDGSDTVTIGALGASVPVSLNMGAGFDVVNVNASAAYDQFVVDTAPTGSGQKVTATNINITNLVSTNTLNFFTNDGGLDAYMPNSGGISQISINGYIAGETMNIHSLAPVTPLFVFGNAGNDVINLGVDGGVDPLRSAVSVYGGNGDDQVWLGPVSAAGVILQNSIAVFGEADNDSLFLGSDNADSVDVNVSFDGGTHTSATGDRIVINDQLPSYNVAYDVSASSVIRDGISVARTIAYANTQAITINCGNGADTVLVRNGVTANVSAFGNNGSDNFTRGDGMITASSTANFNGGAGVDQITFDDRLNPSDVIFDCKPNEVFYGGLISQNTSGFESVGLLAGSGRNEITFDGALSQHFNVNAGGGVDTIKFGFLVAAELSGAVNVNGGSGDDVFQWNRGSNNWSNFGYLSSLFTNPIVLDGGTGYNTLSVDDSVRTVTSYMLTDTGLRATQGDGFVWGSDFTYDNMKALSINCSNDVSNVVVYSVSSDIDPGNQVSILLNGGTDSAAIYPRNANGDLTINGNVGIGGGAGVDAVSINTTTSTLPMNYRFYNPFGAGTASMTGLGTGGFGAGSDVEGITVNAGSGDDTFNVDSFKSGNGVTLNGGDGADICNFGGGNLPSNITSIGSFLFNGETGEDNFNLHNEFHTSAFTYTALANTTLQISCANPSYFRSLEYYNTDHKRVYAGGASDTMNITTFASGELEFHGAAGDDNMNLPTSSDLLGRRVSFFGDGGTLNRIIQNSNSKSAATTLHVGQNQIGAFPGDNFFAPGGSMYFENVNHIALVMGTGADTAYIQPDAVAGISIGGSSPATAPGDRLNLALAGVTSPVLTGSGASGNVQSTNRKTVAYSAFETGPTVDAVAPVAVAIDFNLGGAPRGGAGQTIDVTFTENVSASINAAQLALFNTTLGEFITATAVSFDVNTLVASFSFAGGVLPDGAYQAYIGGVADLFGNVSPASAVYTFIYSGGTETNDTYRVAQDGGTLDYLVYLNDDITPAFIGDLTTKKIVLNGAQGDDSFSVDVAGITPANVYVDGNAGTNSFALTGSTGADNAAITDASAAINGGTVFTSNIGSRSYDTAGEYDSLSIDGAGTTVSLVGADTRFGVLSIGDGAVGYVPTNGDSVLVVRDLIMQPTALLDLADNDLHVESTDPAAYDAVRALVTSAYNFGGWDGYGITSTAARDNPSGNTSLGMLSGEEFANNNGGDFHGAVPASTDVLLKYTYYGDVDFNGSVDVSDYNLIDFGFSNGLTGWGFGDADYSGGATDVSDYNLVDFAFATQGGAL